jgi:lysophospholipase L1-like esterase
MTALLVMIKRDKRILLETANVVIDGNSINTFNVNYGYMTVVRASLLARGTTVSNVAVSARNTTTMIADAAAQVTPKVVAGKANVLIVMEGTNQMVGSTATPAASLMRDYCLARKAEGWYIVLVTAPPIDFNGGNEVANTSQYNNILRQGWREYANYFVDMVALLPQLALPNGKVDKTLFPDGLHPNTTGGALMANVLLANLRLLRQRKL